MSRKTATKRSAPKRRPKLTDSMTKSATELLRAADALHGELMEQCEFLMEAKSGTAAAEDLSRIARLVDEYEQARWPL